MAKHTCCQLLILTLLCSPALAAFNSAGLETFNGTTLDGTTWEEDSPQFISQNDGLFMNTVSNAGQLAQYTTSYEAIDVGGFAQVQVTISAYSLNTDIGQFAYLGLTTNTNKSMTLVRGKEPYSLYIEANVDPETTGFFDDYSSGATNIASGSIAAISLNQPYTLRLDRLSNTSVEYQATNSLGQTIFSETETWPAFSGPVFVALGVDSINAKFNNLQLGGSFGDVPEPEIVVWLLPLTSMLLLGRRRVRLESLAG
jgi:hypothetical protein